MLELFHCVSHRMQTSPSNSKSGKSGGVSRECQYCTNIFVELDCNNLQRREKQNLLSEITGKNGDVWQFRKGKTTKYRGGESAEDGWYTSSSVKLPASVMGNEKQNKMDKWTKVTGCPGCFVIPTILVFNVLSHIAVLCFFFIVGFLSVTF